MEAEEQKFREEVTQTNRQIRDLYKGLKRDKDSLSARIIEAEGFDVVAGRYSG